MTSKKNTSLAEKIANVLNTTPASFDPEDEPIDSTTAQVISNENDDNLNNEEEEVILSKFRKQNIDLLCDVDTKYAGKKSSRRNLKESDEESTSNDEDDNNEATEEQEAEEDDEEVEEEEDEEVEEEEDEEVEEEDEDEQISDYSLSENEQETNFKHMSDSNISNQMKKANCVRNQLSLWENLLEIRIQLQKSVITANQMPQKDYLNEIKQQSGQEFVDKLTKTKHNIYNVLDKLLLLQKLLLKQYPETRNLDNTNENQPTDKDDEEIPSDTEAEDSDQEDDEEHKENVARKKRKLSDYETELNENHKKYKPYRDNVIQKWNDKTRIAVMKTTTPKHSILNQIEYNLSNKEKLVKKTQLRRNQYQILGEQLTDNNEDINEYNPNIYDDTDFYHQLLRELIEVKSSDITDPVQLSRQWIHLQSLRSKMKRKIDTKATKGRKIRYVVHNKLVNFMAPIDNHRWNDDAKTDLYNSLFGKNQPIVN